MGEGGPGSAAGPAASATAGSGPGDFVAVDWGTTNRRAYRLRPDGTLVDDFEDGLGILSVAPGGFPAAVAEIGERFPGLPILMAGMIGSNRGWVEVPYVACPAGLDELVAEMREVGAGTGARVALVPGLSYADSLRADVMRGEEVQILGAVAEGLVPPDGLVCHPGTHNKWIELVAGRVASFRTVLSGELFNLLRRHSILSDLLGAESRLDDAFLAGADHGLLHDDLLAELFAVRARVLVGRSPAEDAASYVSGLLIGQDVRIGLGRVRHDVVTIVGRPDLTRLFAAAVERAGRSTVELDGERAFVAGMRRIHQRMSWT